MTQTDSKIVQNAGRFAPSPTGSPHYGTLLAAVASYVDAKARAANWHIRIEDLDRIRHVEGAADEMLRTLEELGMHWDGEVLYQSTRTTVYEEVLQSLLDQKLAYPCGCTRRDFIQGKYGPEGPVYPGTCRHGMADKKSVRSYRLRVENRDICFEDQVQGRLCSNLETDIGDFIIKRADGFFAYQLAVVIDDAYQEITHVVRGADLLGSTARQIYLQQCLGMPTPAYMHIPLLLDADGKKLSKSEAAAPIDPRHPEQLIFNALTILGQNPPRDFAHTELLEWATQNWQPANVPAVSMLASEAIRPPTA